MSHYHLRSNKTEISRTGWYSINKLETPERISVMRDVLMEAAA